MQSQAKTVDEYLAQLPDDRRAAIEVVRKTILDNLDPDYEEGIIYGMIGYYVPHRIYPAGYHCDPKLPVSFAALASQKNYMSVYLMCNYGDNPTATWFQSEWKKTGKKLDMGKSCIRFKKVEDLALDVIGEAIRRVPVTKYLEFYENALKPRAKTAKPAAKGATAVKKPDTTVSQKGAVKKGTNKKAAKKKSK